MRGKSASNNRMVEGIAARQYGVVSIAQLRAAGVGEDAVHWRVRTGRLHRVHRGVYAVGHRALLPEGRWMAAVLASGRPTNVNAAAGGDMDPDRWKTVLDRWGAAVSHRSAAALWKLLPASEGPVDVSVLSDGGRKKRSGICLHRSLSLVPAAVTLRGGIPVTAPHRTISDLRRIVAATGRPGAISERELRRAIRQADVLGLPIGDQVEQDRTRSDLELAFLRLCRRHRLPPPEVNVGIGPYLVDFLWRDRRLVVETDGYRYHRGRIAFEDDRARDLDLRGRGFELLRVGEKQVDEEPERVAEVLVAALRVGADARASEDRGQEGAKRR
jgi:very-short-patch-repair endonuclease